MELRTMELVARCSAVAGCRPSAAGAAGIERLSTRAALSWPAQLCAARKECGDGNCCAVVWAKTLGDEERERQGFGSALGGKHQWRTRTATTLGFALRSSSVASGPEVAVSKPASEQQLPQPQDGVQSDAGDRGQQGGGEASSSEKERELMEQGFPMSRICDRLIEVFLTEKPTPVQWRSLLALSAEWVRIRPHFYKHCRAMAKAQTIAGKKRELNKLARQVKEVDDNMILHNALLAEIEKNTFEIDTLVAKRRKEFTGEFFEHLQTLSDVSARVNRRDEIATIAGKCLSLIEAYDAALPDAEDITEAQLKFDTILSCPSLEATASKINELAKSKELDSTLLLLITKAWAAAKESTTMKQEVKDIMFYIYNTAKTSMLKLVPDEIHIIKYLLSIADPRERFAAMTDSFCPGDELEEKNENKFHTSPEKLRHWIKLLLDAYHTNKQATMIKEAQKLMNPEVISRLEMLLEYMDDTFV